MNESLVIQTITTALPNVETAEALGFTFFFYKAERNFPFATFVASDTDHDRFSDLDRPGVYRLNIGVSKETFESLFRAGEVDTGSYDYTALDVVMPHPEYAAYHFVCVLSPDSSWEQVKGLLAEAHGLAARRHERQKKDQ